MVKCIPITEKIARFRSTTRRTRAIETVGGIDKVLGCRLRKRGIRTAAQLCRRTERMTRSKFMEFMCRQVSANKRQAGMAYRTLHGSIKDSVIKAKLCRMASKKSRLRIRKSRRATASRRSLKTKRRRC